VASFFCGAAQGKWVAALGSNYLQMLDSGRSVSRFIRRATA